MYTEATNEYHAKIDYANQVLSYLDYIEQEGCVNPVLFLRQMVESDRRVYTKTMNSLLNDMEAAQK